VNVISADEVKRFIISHLSDALRENNVASAEIADDFDLMKQGVIDSIGLIQLVSAIEEHFNLEEVDFEEMDTEELTLIGPLSTYIAGRAKRKSA
jgi:acyl carrier protein